MNLPRWSLRYPVTACMSVISVVLLGALSAVRLPQAFLPEVDFPGLEIQIPYPNALPAQVEESITRPAEEALATLSRVRKIESWSTTQGASLSLQFDWGENVGPLRSEAREKLERVRDRLPPDVDRILVNGFRSSDIPILECRIAADRDLSRDYDLLDRHLADPLRRVSGVAKVELYGVDRPTVQIALRRDALERHGLRADAVLARVDAANRSVSAGRLERGDESWPLRVVNACANLDEMRDLPLDAKGLRLADVATVTLREPELDYGRHLNDSRAIGLNVIKESGANTVQVVERARKVMRQLESDPALTGIRVLTFTDQAEQIQNALFGLLEAGLIGAVLAIGVLLLFLRRLSATLVVAVAIPVSILAACAVMYFTGRSLNVLSMMGLMLAVGMLVDNAVVVLESIVRHRQLGRRPLQAALIGAREVGPAVVCATLTSIIVFLPLVLGGKTEISVWLGEVGRTIIITLLASLALSLIAIPLALGRLLRSNPAPARDPVAGLAARYERVLLWTLRHRPAAVAIAFAVVASSVFPFSKVDKSTFSGSRVERVNIDYEFTDNVGHEEAERYVTRIESWILARKDSLGVTSTYSYFGNNEAFTRAYLATRHADTEGASKLREKLRAGLPSLPGVRLSLGDDDESSGEARVGVRLYGEPGPRLDALAEDVRRQLGTVPGLTDVRVGGEKGRQEVRVAVDRERAASSGTTPARIAEQVALLFRGRPLSRLRSNAGEIEVQARLAEDDRMDRSDLESLPIHTADGGTAPLAALAVFRTAETPAGIQREQRRSVVRVGGYADARKVGEVRQAVSRTMNAISMPAGTTWSFGSSVEEENQTQIELLVNLLLALFLVYFIMAGLFESLLHPFAIMMALPFAFVGIAWTGFLTHTPFNLMAQIGLLILVGIVVNNGIVLIYKVYQLRLEGLDRTEALRTAGRTRLRPILMTTLTTILGLLPLALGGSHVGDVLYYPLARTVMGGLAASTVLTLLLVPCLYTLIEDATLMFGRVWRRGWRAV